MENIVYKNVLFNEIDKLKMIDDNYFNGKIVVINKYIIWNIDSLKKVMEPLIELDDLELQAKFKKEKFKDDKK